MPHLPPTTAAPVPASRLAPRSPAPGLAFWRDPPHASRNSSRRSSATSSRRSVNDGALCSRMPPFVVSSRATNDRPSLRNSREQTVCSSNSSRGGRTAVTARGRLGFADAGAERGFGLVFEGFGRAFGREGDAFLAGFARAVFLPPG